MLWYIFLPTLAKQSSLQPGAAVFAKALPMGKYLRVKSPKGASGGGGDRHRWNKRTLQKDWSQDEVPSSIYLTRPRENS